MPSLINENIINAIGKVVVLGTDKPMVIRGILKSVWDHRSFEYITIGLVNPVAHCPGFQVKLGTKLYVKSFDITSFRLLEMPDVEECDDSDIVDSSYTEESDAEQTPADGNGELGDDISGNEGFEDFDYDAEFENAENAVVEP